MSVSQKTDICFVEFPFYGLRIKLCIERGEVKCIHVRERKREVKEAKRDRPIKCVLGVGRCVDMNIT